MAYLKAVGSAENGTDGNPLGSQTYTGITALDATAQTYNTFVGAGASWGGAIPYDAKLITYYQGQFDLQTVKDLAGANVVFSTNPEFVVTHYGDWPAPEIFVINE